MPLPLSPTFPSQVSSLSNVTLPFVTFTSPLEETFITAFSSIVPLLTVNFPELEAEPTLTVPDVIVSAVLFISNPEPEIFTVPPV